MAVARRMRLERLLGFGILGGVCVGGGGVVCSANEVQVNGGPAVGIAVYGTVFSWINHRLHSYSPNACYWFPRWGWSGDDSRLRIVRADGGIEVRKNGGRDNCESAIVGEAYGSRLRIVRASGGIEVIENGGVTIVNQK